jgi:8-oxo-dGTP pyrophosphatase MutT (NUDIX family)
MQYSFKYPPIDDSWYHRLPGIPEEISAGGVVVRQQAQQVYVALIRERGAPQYVLPKGRLEPGESVEQAAHREIAEEAGLTDLQLLKELGMRERLSFSKRRWKKVYYFLFLTAQIHANSRLLEPGNQLEWFPLDRLPDLYWPEQKALIDFNREHIWQMVG